MQLTLQSTRHLGLLTLLLQKEKIQGPNLRSPKFIVQSSVAIERPDAQNMQMSMCNEICVRTHSLLVLTQVPLSLVSVYFLLTLV